MTATLAAEREQFENEKKELYENYDRQQQVSIVQSINKIKDGSFVLFLLCMIPFRNYKNLFIIMNKRMRDGWS